MVHRVIANNPGPFTYTGTGVYIIGDKNVAVIDPGPITPEHQTALKNALAGRKVTHVFVTHHHIERLEAGDDLTFKPDIEIADGDIFEGEGWTLEALHTPGHTSNHMCYALLQENVLFSGDHIMGWSTSVVSPPDGHMGDYLNSLNRVLDRQFDRIWPTHGPCTHIDKRLYPAAAHSVLAHLIHMEETGRIRSTGAGGLKSDYYPSIQAAE